MNFCKKNIHIYDFINYYHWLPVTSLVPAEEFRSWDFFYFFLYNSNCIWLKEESHIGWLEGE